MHRYAATRSSDMQIKNGDFNMAWFGYEVFDGDEDIAFISTFNDYTRPRYAAYTLQEKPFEIYWYDVDMGATTLAAAAGLALLAFAF